MSEHSEGSAHPLQSGPPESSTSQFSRPLSWPGANMWPRGGCCDRDSARLGVGGSPETWEGCVGWLQREGGGICL